jgi:hypothetical protein
MIGRPKSGPQLGLADRRRSEEYASNTPVGSHDVLRSQAAPMDRVAGDGEREGTRREDRFPSFSTGREPWTGRRVMNCSIPLRANDGETSES